MKFVEYENSLSCIPSSLYKSLVVLRTKAGFLSIELFLCLSDSKNAHMRKYYVCLLRGILFKY